MNYVGLISKQWGGKSEESGLHIIWRLIIKTIKNWIKLICQSIDLKIRVIVKTISRGCRNASQWKINTMLGFLTIITFKMDWMKFL